PLAAHDEARRLDPTVPTSFEYTLIAAGMFDKLPALVGLPNIDPGGLLSSLIFDETNPAGLEALKTFQSKSLPGGVRLIFDAIRDGVNNDADAARRAIIGLTLDGTASGPRFDPEAVFLCAAVSARIGDDDRS